MTTWLRRAAVALAILVAGAAIAFFAMVEVGKRKLERHVDVNVSPIAWRTDAAAIERGRYLFLSHGCAECHGADGAGHVVVDDGKSRFIRAPNITPSADSAVAAYTPVDWVRTIRHGVKPDGRPILIMPSEDYNRLVDADVGAIVAYVRQLAPASGGRAEVRLPIFVNALYAAGVFKDASEKIDHSLPPATPVAGGVTAAHGAYVANLCLGCHGPRLQGGKIPGAPPDWPPAAKLSPGAGSALDRYATAEQFASMLKTGKRPDGSEVSKVMPFASTKELSDVDVRALYLHLRGLPTSP